mgnify:CR=1 FL=1
MNIKYFMFYTNIIYFISKYKYIFWLEILYKLLFNAIFVFQKCLLKLFELLTNFKEKSYQISEITILFRFSEISIFLLLYAHIENIDKIRLK